MSLVSAIIIFVPLGAALAYAICEVCKWSAWIDEMDRQHEKELTGPIRRRAGEVPDKWARTLDEIRALPEGRERAYIFDWEWEDD